jgi:hypothetical protein
LKQRFYADKLDVCGAVGIARTLLYKAHVSEPLYSLPENCEVSDGTNDLEPFLMNISSNWKPSMINSIQNAEQSLLTNVKSLQCISMKQCLVRLESVIVKYSEINYKEAKDGNI